MSKIIGVAGFKGGVGKSTISNFLAEKLGSATIINLDNYQDASDFNSSDTINLKIDDDISLAIKSKSSDFFVIDAGGFDDARLRKVKLDLLILPTRTDYRSIKTTIDSAITITNGLEYDLPILFVINEYEKDSELDIAVDIVENILSLSEIKTDNLNLFAIKKSAAIKTAINKKMSLSELLESNRLAYKSINQQFEDFKDEVLEILGV
jgi:MinD-like ATPase involved in chromosome partitioning or flagellar assembly